MAEQYTELQQYRIDYIDDRKKKIIKRLEEIHKEKQDPVILYETYKELTDEKDALVKEFDSLADEYRLVISARKRYEYHLREAYKLKKTWGFSNEEA